MFLTFQPLPTRPLSWPPIKSPRWRPRREAPEANSAICRRESRLLALTRVRRRPRAAVGFRSLSILPTASSPAEPLVFSPHFSLPPQPRLLPLFSLALPLPPEIKVTFLFSCFRFFAFNALPCFVVYDFSVAWFKLLNDLFLLSI